MLEKERHQLILDILDDKEFASVRDLSAMLRSSEATIRRDLQKLAGAEKVRRIRGGAQATHRHRALSRAPQISGSLFRVEKEQQVEVKRLIAEKAVSLCEDGESIIINGGSSTYMMGEFLRDRSLSILTNSFVLAHELAEQSDNLITLPGGELFRKQGIVVSANDSDLIRCYAADKMFMGTPGIGPRGVTESDLLLLSSEQKLLKQSEKLIVLADSTKIGKRSKFILAPLEQVDMLITDSRADEAVLEEIGHRGVEVVLVDYPEGA